MSFAEWLEGMRNEIQALPGWFERQPTWKAEAPSQPTSVNPFKQGEKIRFDRPSEILRGDDLWLARECGGEWFVENKDDERVMIRKRSFPWQWFKKV